MSRSESKKCSLPRCEHLALPDNTEGFCILHSRNENKDRTRFNETFWDYFEMGGADFRSVWFPPAFSFKVRDIDRPLDFSGSHFRGPADFSRMHFRRDVRFNRVVFHGEADFSDATISGLANFGNACFQGRANFQRAKFTRALLMGNGYCEDQVYFSDAQFGAFNCQHRRFENRVHFDSTQVNGNANFLEATFKGELRMTSSVFNGWMNLSHTSVEWDAKLIDCTFDGPALFKETTFHRAANFSNSRFNDRATFTRTKFKQDAKFQRSEFGETTFDAVSFNGSVSFERCDFARPIFLEGVIFGESVQFTRSVFRDRALFTGSEDDRFIFEEADVDFSGVQLDPGVIFNMRMADLRRCQLADTDLRHIEFSTVEWPQIEMSWYGMQYHRDGVYDELLLEKENQTDAHRARAKKVERIYRALKQNYEERRDYPAAGDFHIGEKEMQRQTTISVPRRRLLGIYRAISLYGERATPVFALLLIAVVLFAIAYAVVGLQIGSSGPVQYLAKSPFIALWHGLIYSLQVTAFSTPVGYALMWSGGIAISVIQRAITTTLIALFALAIRQQLKR